MKKLLLILSVFIFTPLQPTHAMAQKVANFISVLEYNQCPICLENLVDGKKFVKIKCNPDAEIYHSFHVECLNDGIRAGIQGCPLCRSDSLRRENYSLAFFENNAQLFRFGVAGLLSGFLRGVCMATSNLVIAKSLAPAPLSANQACLLLGATMLCRNPIFNGSINIATSWILNKSLSWSTLPDPFELIPPTNKQTKDRIHSSALFGAINMLLHPLIFDRLLQVETLHTRSRMKLIMSSFIIESIGHKSLNIYRTLIKPCFNYDFYPKHCFESYIIPMLGCYLGEVYGFSIVSKIYPCIFDNVSSVVDQLSKLGNFKS